MKKLLIISLMGLLIIGCGTKDESKKEPDKQDSRRFVCTFAIYEPTQWSYDVEFDDDQKIVAFTEIVKTITEPDDYEFWAQEYSDSILPLDPVGGAVAEVTVSQDKTLVTRMIRIEINKLDVEAFEALELDEIQFFFHITQDYNVDVVKDMLSSMDYDCTDI